MKELDAALNAINFVPPTANENRNFRKGIRLEAEVCDEFRPPGMNLWRSMRPRNLSTSYCGPFGLGRVRQTLDNRSTEAALTKYEGMLCYYTKTPGRRENL